MKPIAEEIKKLRAMKAADLVGRYTDLFGKPPRVKNREHVWNGALGNSRSRDLADSPE